VLTFFDSSFLGASALGAAATGAGAASPSTLAFLASFFFWVLESCSTGFSSTSTSSALRFLAAFLAGFSIFSTILSSMAVILLGRCQHKLKGRP
jgi:hypothetical protein